MKQIINHPAFKIVVFGLFFVFSSITIFYDYSLITSFFSPSYRGVAYFLPTFVVYLLPTISMIFYYHCIHNSNVKKLFRILSFYVALVGSLSVICLVGAIIVATVGDFNLVSIDQMFPYDTIALSAIYLASVVIIIAYLFKNRIDMKIAYSSTKKIGFVKNVVGIVLLVFAAFFFGDFLSIIRLFQEPFDENFFLMIPILLTFLYGVILVVLYVIYKNIKDFEMQFTFFKNSLFIFTIYYLFLNTFVVASTMVNLHIFEQSMISFFPSEGYLHFPIGIIITIAGPLGPIVYSCLRFGKVKNEQKQKENSNQI